MSSPFGDVQPDISYPCRWPYTVIGEDEFKMRVAVGEVCGDQEHTIEISNRSRTGRYCSLKVEAVVNDEEQRHRVFHELLRKADIRFVV